MSRSILAAVFCLLAWAAVGMEPAGEPGQSGAEPAAALPEGPPPAAIDGERLLWMVRLYPQGPLCYLEADRDRGWHAQTIVSNADLLGAYERASRNKGLIVPIFPSVYPPGDNQVTDRVYYNYLIKSSGIKPGDKVLVIGSGSGADTWLAWLGSRTVVYAIDINPLAVANTRATAQLAGAEANVIEGDIAWMELPPDFKSFDFVLWNMPFITDDRLSQDYEKTLHDGDHGGVLGRFLKRLPGLLKPGGKAILLNNDKALGLIAFPHQEVIPGEDSSVLFVVTND